MIAAVLTTSSDRTVMSPTVADYVRASRPCVRNRIPVTMLELKWYKRLFDLVIALSLRKIQARNQQWGRGAVASLESGAAPLPGRNFSPNWLSV